MYIDCIYAHVNNETYSQFYHVIDCIDLRTAAPLVRAFGR